MARPTLLTKEMIKDFAKLLPTVMYLESVAAFLGVNRVTWRLWIKRGAKEARRLARSKAGKPRESEALYLEFFNTYKKGLAKGEIDDARRVQEAAKEQWQAAAWRLERRFPERWGPRTREIAEMEKIIKDQAKQINDLLKENAANPGGESGQPGPGTPGEAPANP